MQKTKLLEEHATKTGRWSILYLTWKTCFTNKKHWSFEWLDNHQSILNTIFTWNYMLPRISGTSGKFTVKTINLTFAPWLFANLNSRPQRTRARIKLSTSVHGKCPISVHLPINNNVSRIPKVVHMSIPSLYGDPKSWASCTSIYIRWPEAMVSLGAQNFGTAILLMVRNPKYPVDTPCSLFPLSTAVFF